MSRRGTLSFYKNKDKKNDQIILGLLSSHLRTRQAEVSITQRSVPKTVAPISAPPLPLLRKVTVLSPQFWKSPQPRKSPQKFPPITRSKSKSIAPVDYTEYDDDVIEVTPGTPTAPIKKRKTIQGVEKNIQIMMVIFRIL